MSASATDLYLSRRDAYAAFLSAADDESSVCWWKADGQYPSVDATRQAQDAAYAATRDAFNRIVVEPVGPHKEAHAVIEQIRQLGRAGTEEQDWVRSRRPVRCSSTPPVPASQRPSAAHRRPSRADPSPSATRCTTPPFCPLRARTGALSSAVPRCP
ncbi:hypothetical protein CG747_39660 [Streptomyces sp. CB02959]|nr:hypothetical protein CG747_39660 [Streptomyces sp. CB02959]